MKKYLVSSLSICMFLATLFGLVTIGSLNINTTTAYATEVAEHTEVASGICGTSLTWVLDSNGELHITGEGAMSTYSNGTAPWYSYADSITAIIISDAVTSISSSAFYGCDSLHEITLPFVGVSRTITTSTSATSATDGIQALGLQRQVLPERQNNFGMGMIVIAVLII